MEYKSSDKLKNNEKGIREWYENSIHEKSDWKSFRERKKCFPQAWMLDNNVEVFHPHKYGYVDVFFLCIIWRWNSNNSTFNTSDFSFSLYLQKKKLFQESWKKNFSILPLRSNRLSRKASKNSLQSAGTYMLYVVDGEGKEIRQDFLI